MWNHSVAASSVTTRRGWGEVDARPARSSPPEDFVSVYSSLVQTSLTMHSSTCSGFHLLLNYLSRICRMELAGLLLPGVTEQCQLTHLIRDGSADSTTDLTTSSNWFFTPPRSPHTIVLQSFRHRMIGEVWLEMNFACYPSRGQPICGFFVVLNTFEHFPTLTGKLLRSASSC